MEIETGVNPGALRVSSYGPGYFVINDRRVEGSIVLTPEQLVEGWSPSTVADLDEPTLAVVDDLECDVVLLGTGTEHRFPSEDVLAPVRAKGIGVEVMSSDAACRTYNILMAEGRRVAALLIAVD